MSRDQRRPRMPKPRIPVAPPSIRHKSAKDYERVKKVEIPNESQEDYWDRVYEPGDWSDEQDHARNDLLFLLMRFNIASSFSWRKASYGKTTSYP